MNMTEFNRRLKFVNIYTFVNINTCKRLHGPIFSYNTIGVLVYIFPIEIHTLLFACLSSISKNISVWSELPGSVAKRSEIRTVKFFFESAMYHTCCLVAYPVPMKDLEVLYNTCPFLFKALR